MASLPKSFSLQLKRKPNSHNKLPKLQMNQQKNRIQQSSSKQRENKTLLNPIAHMIFEEDKKKSLTILSPNKKQIKDILFLQQMQMLQPKSKNSISVIKLNPIAKQDNDKTEPSSIRNSQKKQKINKEIQQGNEALKSDSAMSSRMSLHPVVNQIQNLISDQAKKFIMPTKSYHQNLIGQISAIWWCVIDSLFISLQKILKIKQTQPFQLNISPQKQSKQPKSPTKLKNQKQNPVKNDRKKQQDKTQKKTISGIVESNTKISIEIARAYCHLQNQNKKNEQIITRYYQDPNHLSLILQAIFYQKAIIYLLGTIRKWSHHEQLLYIHSMAIDIIPCIIQCRKLMIDILMQAVENQQHDNKIRKPKYIARQKKLIQISKFTTMIKSEYQKYINSLGSPHRYKVFQFPQSLKQYAVVQSLQNKWKSFVFDVPLAPYIADRGQSRKQYLLVIQPLNILYKYNKKQESLQLDPYVEIFLKDINRLFDVVLFTCIDKHSSLLNFLGVLDKAQILGVLDKDYLTYQQAKPIKDINKIGAGYPKNKILVLDQKANAKYYTGIQKSLLYLIEGKHAQTKIARVNGKLVRLDDQDQEYLKNMANRIINCAERGGNWQEIISSNFDNQKNQKKK